MTNAEIQVGEYVRTTSGFIAKCIEKDEYYLGFDGSVKISYGELWSNLYPSENDILNHSFNLIDLIEAGDYVNGIEVKEFDDDEGHLYLGFGIFTDSCMDCIEEIRPLSTVDIRTIVTK